MTFKMNGSEFFNFTKCRTRIVPRLFFLVLGSYDVKRSWNSTFDFYTFPPSVCSVQLQSYTFSAPSYFCSFTVYVWGQIISEVEILYIQALQIHVRLKTFEIESLFLWAFVLALVRRMTAAAAPAAAAVTTFAMYWEGIVLKFENFSFQSYQNKNL